MEAKIQELFWGFFLKTPCKLKKISVKKGVLNVE